VAFIMLLTSLSFSLSELLYNERVQNPLKSVLKLPNDFSASIEVIISVFPHSINVVYCIDRFLNAEVSLLSRTNSVCRNFVENFYINIHKAYEFCGVF
jgi:hypothetical protein